MISRGWRQRGGAVGSAAGNRPDGGLRNAERGEVPEEDDGSHDDATLAQRFASAEPDAVRDLYARFAGPVHTVALCILGDHQLAAEAVQVTFLKAWRAAKSYDPTRPLAPWIYAIARRAAIDIQRSERRHGSHNRLSETDATVAPLGIERAWEAWQVRSAIDRLPEHERRIIRLQHFEQLTHSEIAQRLRVPAGTVKSRSFRAHRRLASELAHLSREESS